MRTMEKISSSESMDMGLQHLAIESDQTHVMTSSILSRTSSSSSAAAAAIGDYIGTESCFDVLSVDDLNDAVFPEPVRNIPPPCRRKEEKSEAREFPPPIPGLARTENHPSHMPWVLTRVYTSDGRLILREEKVRHHEYFRAHRSNGRLTLQLVPLDGGDENDVVWNHDDDDHHHDHEDDKTSEDIVMDNGEGDGEKDDVIVHDDDNVDSVHQTAVEIGGGGSPGGKCLKSCFLGMQVAKIRPVLSYI